MDRLHNTVTEALQAKVKASRWAVLAVDGWNDHQHLETLGCTLIDLTDGTGRPVVLDPGIPWASAPDPDPGPDPDA